MTVRIKILFGHIYGQIHEECTSLSEALGMKPLLGGQRLYMCQDHNKRSVQYQSASMKSGQILADPQSQARSTAALQRVAIELRELLEQLRLLFFRYACHTINEVCTPCMYTYQLYMHTGEVHRRKGDTYVCMQAKYSIAILII